MTKLLIYSFITIFIIIIGLIYCNKKITEDTQKDKILKIFAVTTVIIHYSSLWVDFFTTGQAVVDGTMLLPIYPCNICMWLLLIVAFMKNKETFIYKTITEFLCIAGTICGLIGLFANEIFLANPDFLDYSSLKGLLSHSTMIFGTMYLLTSGYVRINALSLTLSTALGLLLFVIDGAIINGLFALFNLPSVNAMFMLEFPFDIKGLNFMSLGILGVILAFIFGNIYELIFTKPEQRWYHNIHKRNHIKEF